MKETCSAGSWLQDSSTIRDHAMRPWPLKQTDDFFLRLEWLPMSTDSARTERYRKRPVCKARRRVPFFLNTARVTCPFRRWLQECAVGPSGIVLSAGHPGATPKSAFHTSLHMHKWMRWAEPESKTKQALNIRVTREKHCQDETPPLGFCARERKGMWSTTPALLSTTKRGCCWITTEISVLGFLHDALLWKQWLSRASVGSVLKRHSSSQGLSKNEDVFTQEGLK